MTEETQQLLENLRLKKMATILDQELENAKNNSPSYSEFLLRLLQAQWHERQEKCLQYRIQQARLPEQWTLESFPFKKQPGVSRRQIQELAELEFIPRAENIVFIGPTGVGKTGLASGLLRSEEHTSELQSRQYLVCRLLLEKKKRAPVG